MTRRDLALAVTVASVWGGSFIVVKWGLHDMPPLLFASLRFVPVAVLAAFLPRPAMSLRTLAVYGVVWGAVQYGGLFCAMGLGMPAGVASVVAQSQVLFTTLFAVALGLERPTARHLQVGALAATGLGVVGLAAGAGVTAAGFGALLVGASGWAGGNVMLRQLARNRVRVDTLGFLAWAAIVPAVTLLTGSLVVEGPGAIGAAAAHWTWRTTAVLAYQCGGAMIAGALIWNLLLRRYAASAVAPFGLLVPVTGILGGWLAFGEVATPTQWLGSALLCAAVALNLAPAARVPAPAAAPVLGPRS
jgi:O-acetylserine/cysteine efflux transporter